MPRMPSALRMSPSTSCAFPAASMAWHPGEREEEEATHAPSSLLFPCFPIYFSLNVHMCVGVSVQSSLFPSLIIHAFLSLSPPSSPLSCRVESAIRMKSVVKEMSTVTKAMDTVLSSMDPEKIAGMMDRFESLFDSMDVRTGYMDQAMASSTASSVPEDEVDNLIKMVQERNAIDMKDSLDGARVGSGAVMSPGAGVAAGPAKTAVAAGVLPPAPPTGPPGGPGTGPDGGAGGGSGGGGGGGGMDVADALAARLAGLRK